MVLEYIGDELQYSSKLYREGYLDCISIITLLSFILELITVLHNIKLGHISFEPQNREMKKKEMATLRKQRINHF
jgi:hypothetical protein